jgi:L-aminopeptidase/D-esterase-like protein
MMNQREVGFRMTLHWHKTPSGKTRLRGLGIHLPGTPGEFNAITDVAGVEVGYMTLIRGEGPLVVGEGPVRTGVTAILPRGRGDPHTPCAAGSYSFNGNGELSGLLWVEESGELTTPITITNTHSCGVARDATVQWLVKQPKKSGQDWGLPVAGETYDGELNDINGFHVKAEHVIAALDGARGGPIELGSVGGGTGMLTFDFKAGSGSASRLVTIHQKVYTIAAFVQSNFGRRHEMVVAGRKVGLKMPGGELRGRPVGSIIAVIATDAPLLPHQLKRIARRVPIGIARTGGIGHNGSGDIFIAFSTANREAYSAKGDVLSMQALANGRVMDPLFEATAQATEEAILDSLIANDTMTGADGHVAVAVSHERLKEALAARDD